jgi:ATP-dependent DNA helicase RecQ
MDELLKEMESIVYQGTKLNIDYYIEDNFDEDIVDGFMEFMNESESDSMKVYWMNSEMNFLMKK